MNETIVNPTIVMPKETLASWLEALRSGRFEQGVGQLEREFNGKTTHCCLGVLQMVVDGKVEQDPNVPEAAALPSMEWLERNKIQFTDIYGVSCRNPGFKPAAGVVPHEFVFVYNAACVNDSGEYDFNAIADLIEANSKGT